VSVRGVGGGAPRGGQARVGRWASCFAAAATPHSLPPLPRFPRRYKGLVPTIISGAPYTGLQMTSYEIFKRNSPDGGHGVLWSLLNGSLSGLVAQTVTYPGDTIRRRMQNNGAGGAERVYRNTWDCTVQTWRKEGVRGFFRGAWTNTVRAVPGAAIQFASYELIKTALGC